MKLKKKNEMILNTNNFIYLFQEFKHLRWIKNEHSNCKILKKMLKEFNKDDRWIIGLYFTIHKSLLKNNKICINEVSLSWKSWYQGFPITQRFINQICLIVFWI